MPANTPVIGNDLRVLVLTKRQYMGRDLLDDRYGRFRELPLALAVDGARVGGLCLSYRTRPSGQMPDRSGAAVVNWYSVNATCLPSPLAGGYLAELDRRIVQLRPNLIWACSDVPHAVLGTLARRRSQARLVIDLYDNFESYPLARLPGVNRALDWAMRSADGITCVSAPLRDRLRAAHSVHGPIEVIENAVDPGVFYPRDRTESRLALGLPSTAILIGTAGAISRSRGIETLFKAYSDLACEREDVHLVLAGPVGRGLVLPTGPRVHYLGRVEPDRVPRILSALDIAMICNRDSAFGRYCFPQKLYEAIACGTPVLAARVGTAAQLLGQAPASTYEPDNAASLLDRLRDACQQRAPLSLPVPTWQSQGVRLAACFRQVLESAKASAGTH